MLLITPQQLCLGIAAAIFLIALAYIYGYETGIDFSKKAQAYLKTELGSLAKREKDLNNWVASNWPDELAAYNHGAQEAYQAGINDAPYWYDQEKTA